MIRRWGLFPTCLIYRKLYLNIRKCFFPLRVMTYWARSPSLETFRCPEPSAQAQPAIRRCLGLDVSGCPFQLQPFCNSLIHLKQAHVTPKTEKQIAGRADLKPNLPVIQNFSSLLTRCSKALWSTCRMMFCSVRRFLSRHHSAPFGIKVHLQNTQWHSVFLAGTGLPFCVFLREKDQLKPQIKQTF